MGKKGRARWVCSTVSDWWAKGDLWNRSLPHGLQNSHQYREDLKNYTEIVLAEKRSGELKFTITNCSKKANICR